MPCRTHRVRAEPYDLESAPIAESASGYDTMRWKEVQRKLQERTPQRRKARRNEVNSDAEPFLPEMAPLRLSRRDFLGLMIQGGQNPLLQHAAKMRSHVREQQSHPGGLRVNYVRHRLDAFV